MFRNTAILLFLVICSKSAFCQNESLGISEFPHLKFIKSFNSNSAITLGENGKIGKWDGKNWRFQIHNEISNLNMQHGWFLDTSFGYFYLYNNVDPTLQNDTSHVYSLNNNSIKFAGFKKGGVIVSMKFYNKDLGAVLLVDSMTKGYLYWFNKGLWSMDPKFKCKISSPSSSNYINGNLLEFNNEGDLYVLTNKELLFHNSSGWNIITSVPGGNDIKLKGNKGYVLNNISNNTTLYYFNGIQWNVSKKINESHFIEPFNLNNIWTIYCTSYSWNKRQTTKFISHYRGTIVNNQFQGLFPEQTNWISMHDSLNGWICGDNYTLIKIENGKPIMKANRPTIQSLRAIHMKDNDNGICVGDSGSVCIKRDGVWSLLTHPFIKKNQFWTTCYFADTSEFLIAGNNGIFLLYKNNTYRSNIDFKFTENLAGFRDIKKISGKYRLTSGVGLFEFDGSTVTLLFSGSCDNATIARNNTYLFQGSMKNTDGTYINGLMYIENKELIQVSGPVEYCFMTAEDKGIAWAGGRTYELKPVIGWQEMVDCRYNHQIVGNKFGTIVKTLDGNSGYYIVNSHSYFFKNNKSVVDLSGNYYKHANPRFDDQNKYNARIVNGACITSGNIAYVCASDGMIFSYRMNQKSNSLESHNKTEAKQVESFTFPNPFVDHFNIESDNFGMREYQIINAQGIVVKTGVLNIASDVINLNNVNSGLYFLNINGSPQIKLLKTPQ